ncbi:MAG TPA: RNA 2',3'-cyclic phosphodiesterase [Burkholderiales bacterium]|nr:RNA 2',3'-cyclic phosphodiesterase [Burkholderiales bacterium]
MADTSRIFFALWPNAEQVKALQEAQHLATPFLKGRNLSPETFHLTLVFLGEIPNPKIPELIQTISSIRFLPFEIKLNLLETWPQINLLSAVPKPVPEDLIKLQARLTAILDQTGCSQKKLAFLPHVSLMRNIQGTLPLIKIDILWRICEFVLAQSCPTEQGPHYALRSRFLATSTL